MADRSAIEWTDSTFNPWIGCTKVSDACTYCYAEVSTAARARGVHWGHGMSRHRTSAANWKLPLRWNAQPFFECEKCRLRTDTPMRAQCIARDKQLRTSHAWKPARRRVFCASLADVFDNEVPVQWRADLFALIRATPNLDWLLLTKRIGNAATMMNEAASAVMDDFCGAPTWESAPWSNVWIGATICNQAEADRDVPKLLRVPAAVRFLSIEPMLGQIDITEHLWGRAKPCDGCPKDADCDCGWYPRGELTDEPAIGWVIVGGESGPHARPMHPDWARSLRDQCAAACVPFLFKQWGEFAPSPDVTASNVEWLDPAGYLQSPLELNGKETAIIKIGKKAAGRLLDGVTHDGYPVSS